MAPNDVCKIRLESIAPGGDALGRFGGKPIFVEGGAPDETVLCRIREENKTWARAKLLEIVEPSPVRVEAACAFYGKCGGCNLQHIDYDAQLAAKTAVLMDSLSRIGGVCPPEPEVFPCAPWEYRNRMQFHCLRQLARGDGPGFGLKGRRSGEIIAVTDCPVAAPEIREILRKGGKTLPLPPEKDRFTVFSYGKTFLSEGGVQRGKVRLLEKEVIINAGVFFQSNIVMLEKLIIELMKTAVAACGSGVSSQDVGAASPDVGVASPVFLGATRGSMGAADLYCGVGTFAVFLSEMFQNIVLAEENKKAVNLARENLRDGTFEFFVLRDSEWEKRLLRRNAGFAFAVADPPRAGLAPALASALAWKGPPLLAYVSCDAAALARDSKILTGGGYELKKLKLFDFYPQTAHIESLAVFERREK
jgi:23S rRNA (uracil1939-C5)-methyltransferase